MVKNFCLFNHSQRDHQWLLQNGEDVMELTQLGKKQIVSELYGVLFSTPYMYFRRVQVKKPPFLFIIMLAQVDWYEDHPQRHHFGESIIVVSNVIAI